MYSILSASNASGRCWKNIFHLRDEGRVICGITYIRSASNASAGCWGRGALRPRVPMGWQNGKFTRARRERAGTRPRARRERAGARARARRERAATWTRARCERVKIHTMPKRWQAVAIYLFLARAGLAQMPAVKDDFRCLYTSQIFLASRPRNAKSAAFVNF